MRRDTSVTWSDECSRIMDAATDEISGVSQWLVALSVQPDACGSKLQTKSTAVTIEYGREILKCICIS
jgi:hypothetical protein